MKNSYCGGPCRRPKPTEGCRASKEEEEGPYRYERVMKYIVHMVLMRGFITIHSSIQVILRSLPQELERFSVGITDWGDLWSTAVRWHDVHTMSPDDRFRHSGNNDKIISSSMSESTMLVLLMWGIYEAHCWGDLRWHDRNIRFHDEILLAEDTHIDRQTHCHTHTHTHTHTRVM
jgi:hypothetical protein